MIRIDELYEQVREGLDDLAVELASLRGDDLWEAGSELGRLLRTAAIGALLVELDGDAYERFLTKSAETRLHVLAHAGTRPARYIKLSRADGFFDALAVRRFDLAAAIETRSAEDWTPQFEYEDDFAYVKTLHLLARPTRSSADRTAAAEHVARIEAVLGGQDWGRLDVCRALTAGDAEDFDEAFGLLVDEYDREIAAQRNGLGRDDLTFAAGQYVFVEGLALLSLASALGLPTRDEYPYCPRETVALARTHSVA